MQKRHAIADVPLICSFGKVTDYSASVTRGTDSLPFCVHPIAVIANRIAIIAEYFFMNN